MKYFKGIFLIVTILSSHCANAQDISKGAVGIRVGSSNGYGPEISYQGFLVYNTRLEIGLRMKDENGLIAYKLRTVHEWVFEMPGEFQWFWGVGANSGYVDHAPEENRPNSFLFGLESVIGLEYSFLQAGMPIQLMLDFSPRIDLINEFSKRDATMDISAGIRYLF